MKKLLQPPPNRDQMPARRIPPTLILMRADLFPAGLLVRGCFALGLVLQSRQAPAQEALRNSLAGDAAAEARHISPEAMPYTFKNGDFRLLLSPSLDLDWNDNVYLSKNSPQDDYILRPTVGIDASYPLTDKNLLRLDVTLGYAWYLNHHDLSSLYLASGSQVSFDILIKDLLLNLHDSFSYIQEILPPSRRCPGPVITAPSRTRRAFREPGTLTT